MCGESKESVVDDADGTNLRVGKRLRAVDGGGLVIDKEETSFGTTKVRKNVSGGSGSLGRLNSDRH